MSPDLDDLVDLGGLGPGDEARLRRVHELLVAAGPPEELPAALAAPPGAAPVVALASRRRRPALAVLLAAAVAVACFGTGYVIANEAHGGAHVAQIVSLEGQQNSFASLRVDSADANGNSPMQLSVSGLAPLANSHAHYVLMVWQDGKPSTFIGMFKVGSSGAATVSFSAPFPITRSTRFVVTEMGPGVHFPGQVVMTSS